MTPTEKRLREALELAMEWNWLDPDMPVEIVKQCEAALAAIPSETGGEDDKSIARLREGMEMQGGLGLTPHIASSVMNSAADRIESLQAQLASLRAEIEEQVAQEVEEYVWTLPEHLRAADCDDAVSAVLDALAVHLRARARAALSSAPSPREKEKSAPAKPDGWVRIVALPDDLVVGDWLEITEGAYTTRARIEEIHHNEPPAGRGYCVNGQWLSYDIITAYRRTAGERK